MKIVGIIPARFASTRFPGKPLAMINGVSMIQRVYGQAKCASMLSQVVVATDDHRIMDHVVSFGGVAVMTSSEHPSGTDRCAEVLKQAGQDWDAVINIQGDEPYIHPEQIDQVASQLHVQGCQIATLIKPVASKEEFLNVNVPKVVVGEYGQALYFSRQPIPHLDPAQIPVAIANQQLFRHIGIYGYQAQTLTAISSLQPVNLERMESLEQLRWLYHGYAIHVGITHLDNHAVDVPEDVLRLEQIFKA
jgi:3-deoxy-manno-octulosonate cytidylyltransferase (CMP-KDO synthetase)